MDLSLDIRLPEPLADKPTRTEIDLTVYVHYGASQPQREDFSDKMARLLIHIPREGRFPSRKIVLADLEMRFVHMTRDGNVERYYVPHYRKQKHINVPRLWPGWYKVTCQLLHMRNHKGVSLFGPSVESRLHVRPRAVGPAPKHNIPIFLSNIFEIVDQPDINVSSIGHSKIPFTWKQTGYPLVESTRVVGKANPRAKPAILNPLISTIQQYVDSLNYEKQIFSPVFKWGTDGRLAFRSRQVALNATIPGQNRENSRRLSYLGKGIFKTAIEDTSSNDQVKKLRLQETFKSSIDALLHDPDNLHAYLWAAMACAYREEWVKSYDFFLTLIGRLRLAERILVMHKDTPNFVFMLVEGLVKRYLEPEFAADFKDCAVNLGLTGFQSFPFPRIQYLIQSTGSG